MIPNNYHIGMVHCYLALIFWFFSIADVVAGYSSVVSSQKLMAWIGYS